MRLPLLTVFIYGILYSIPTFGSCGGTVGTFGGTYTSNLPLADLSITVDTNSHDNHVAGENSIVTVMLIVPDGTVALYGTCIADPPPVVCPFMQTLEPLTLTTTLVAVSCDESDIDATIPWWQ